MFTKTFLLNVLLINSLVITHGLDNLCTFLNEEATGKISAKCLIQMNIVCKNPEMFFTMADASSKYPNSGILYSNNKDFGNFDQCMSVNFKDISGTVKGKHCPYSAMVVNIGSEPIPSPFSLTLPHGDTNKHFNSTFLQQNKDLLQIGERAINYASLSMLSTCIPDECLASEVGKYILLPDWLNQTVGVPLLTFVDPNPPTVPIPPCSTLESNTEWSAGDLAFLIVLSLILLTIILSTIYDSMLYYQEKKPSKPVFLAFSLLTNTKKLLHTTTSYTPEQIPCLNGMRFISMMWVIAGHGVVAYEALPILNFKEIEPWMNNPMIMYLAAAPIAVDTFFFLSGLLLAFSYMKSQVKLPVTKQVMSVPMMVLHRYLRLTPAVGMAFFWVITLNRKLSSGPLWQIVAIPMKETCEKHWWQFFIYVQNYVNYQNICLNHTWYLSADMQMFLLAPIVLIPAAVLIRNNQTKQALIGICILTVILTGIPMLPRFLDWSIDNTYDTHSRLNDYLFGVMLGIYLRVYRDKKYPFNRVWNILIWIVVFAVSVGFIMMYHNVVRDDPSLKLTNEKEHTKDTLFYGLYRPIWSLCLTWMVYSCYKGHGGIVNWFLTRPIFQIGARLSYCMYIMHAIVESVWVGIQRNPVYWSNYMIFYVWCGHFIMTMAVSFVWTLAFEAPMITIEKFIFGGASKPNPKPVESGKV